MTVPGGRLALAAAAAAGTAAAGAGLCLLRRRLAVVTVVGPSMQPTLAPGDRVLARRVGPGDIRVGQIAVIEKPGDDGAWPAGPRTAGRRTPGLRAAGPRATGPWAAGRPEWMIKRVAAVPGDERPEFLPTQAAGSGAVVPAGQFVVLGDNPARSLDSRQIGYVPADRVLGVVVRSLRAA
jgi:signal peptidase I